MFGFIVERQIHISLTQNCSSTVWQARIFSPGSDVARESTTTAIDLQGQWHNDPCEDLKLEDPMNISRVKFGSPKGNWIQTQFLDILPICWWTKSCSSWCHRIFTSFTPRRVETILLGFTFINGSIDSRWVSFSFQSFSDILQSPLVPFQDSD